MTAIKRRLGLTIVEVMVVVVVAGVVLGLTLRVYRHAVRLSRQTACLSNLRQVAVALNCYHTEYSQLPRDDAPATFDEALGPFVKNLQVLRCPADPIRTRSSYAPYYVQRREMTGQDFIVGCPLHSDGRVTTILVGTAGTEGHALGRITHNGAPVAPGARVTGGLLRFADGSVASLEAGLSVDVVTSFERGDGSYYTILRLPADQVGGLGLDVNPNSRLEVVTPAAIAGSEGTRFYVFQYGSGTVVNDGVQTTIGRHVIIYTASGKVKARNRGYRRYAKSLTAGEGVLIEQASGTMTDYYPPTKGGFPVLP